MEKVDRSDQEEKRGDQKGREQTIQQSVPYVLSTAWNTQRSSQSYLGKRRGRDETVVTRRRRGGVKRKETDLATNYFLKCSPQSGMNKEIHRIG